MQTLASSRDIVGIHWREATVTGIASHAGITPMDQRHDALLAASEQFPAGLLVCASVRFPSGILDIGSLLMSIFVPKWLSS